MSDPKTPVYHGNKGDTTSGSTSGSGGGKGGGKGGGGGTTDPYAAAQAKADRKEREAKNKARQRYLGQVGDLQIQINALKKAMNGAFQARLKTALNNRLAEYKGQSELLMDQYGQRVGEFKKAESDNEKAAGDQSFAALSNRGRERANAVSEAMNNGAGESDVLQAQQMALHNWNANQSEVNRSLFDSTRSINANLRDATLDTQTARVNLLTDYNDKRESLWNSYYDQQSQAATQLGNLYGQQSELYGLAQEQATKGQAGSDKKGHGRTRNQSKGAFNAASSWMGKAWKSPGIPDSLLDWKGTPEFRANMGNTQLADPNVVSNVAATAKRPSGSTLREWS